MASGQRNISSERVRSSTSEWVARCAAACHGGATLVTMATLRALAPANPRDLRDNWIDLDQSFDRSIYIFRFPSDQWLATQLSPYYYPRKIFLSSVNLNKKQRNRSTRFHGSILDRSIRPLASLIDRSLFFPLFLSPFTHESLSILNIYIYLVDLIINYVRIKKLESEYKK